MMSKMSPEGSSIVVSRLALIQSAVVVTLSHSVRLMSPRIIYLHWTGVSSLVGTIHGKGLVYLLIFSEQETAVLFCPKLMTACSWSWQRDVCEPGVFCVRTKGQKSETKATVLCVRWA